MIAEPLPGCYDAVGKKVLRPDLRRHGVQPTFPLGRYTSHRLTVHCQTIEEVRKFLSTCKPVSGKEQFGRDDYWQPPEDFEKRRKGDCDDYALWAWRQFLELGYQARFVMGRSGRFGIGHAWVSIERGGKQCLVEPQLRDKLPLLSIATYKPECSVEWVASAFIGISTSRSRLACPAECGFQFYGNGPPFGASSGSKSAHACR
jgi:hypothetical protein